MLARDYRGALEKIGRLDGVSYRRKSDGKREIGVMAEQVDQIVPEVVSGIAPAPNECSDAEKVAQDS